MGPADHRVTTLAFRLLADENIAPDVVSGYVFPLGLREGRLSCGAGRLGTGTGTTVSPSMPAKSFGLHVYKGNPFARAVAAIMTS